MINTAHAIFHPEQFQGRRKTNRYFEGWYYKVVNAAETDAFAFIPGIAMDANGNQHAFIQVMDGIRRTATYHTFPASDFHPCKGKFEIALGDNLFTDSTLKLDLPGASGRLTFTALTPWPNPWYSPGIMGPYTFVPFMECYHGILSMDHIINGELTIQGKTIDFTNGRGYMEKDWGQSFPSAYFWMQTNHFSVPGISLKASVANIPWLGSSFTGFIAGIWLHDRLIQFTTYNGTRLLRSFADSRHVQLVMDNKNYRLEILAHREAVTQLASPISGFMTGRIEESMTSRIEVCLIDKKTNTIILKDTGRNAGLEVAGEIKEITI